MLGIEQVYFGCMQPQCPHPLYYPSDPYNTVFYAYPFELMNEMRLFFHFSKLTCSSGSREEFLRPYAVGMEKLHLLEKFISPIFLDTASRQL